MFRCTCLFVKEIQSFHPVRPKDKQHLARAGVPKAGCLERSRTPCIKLEWARVRERVWLSISERWKLAYRKVASARFLRHQATRIMVVLTLCLPTPCVRLSTLDYSLLQPAYLTTPHSLREITSFFQSLFLAFHLASRFNHR